MTKVEWFRGKQEGLVKHQDQQSRKPLPPPGLRGQGKKGAPEPASGASGPGIHTSFSLSPHPLASCWFLLLSQTKRKPRVLRTVWAQSPEVSSLGYRTGWKGSACGCGRTNGEGQCKTWAGGIWEGFSGQYIKGAIPGALEAESLKSTPFCNPTALSWFLTTAL